MRKRLQSLKAHPETLFSRKLAFNLIKSTQRVEESELLTTLKSLLIGNITNNIINDHVSASNGLEQRVPFLDHNFIEKYWSLPLPGFFANGIGKSYIRKSMFELYPLKAFKDRKKKPKPGNYYALINDNNLYDLAMEIP